MKSFINLLDDANAEIKTISVTELKSIMNQSDIVIIDVQSKDVIEKVGMIPNAIHANRGFLEFYADQREDNPFKKSEIDNNKKMRSHLTHFFKMYTTRVETQNYDNSVNIYPFLTLLPTFQQKVSILQKICCFQCIFDDANRSVILFLCSHF